MQATAKATAKANGQATTKVSTDGWHTINRRKHKERNSFAARPSFQSYIPYKTKPLYSKIHLANSSKTLASIQKPLNPPSNSTTTLPMTTSPPPSPPPSPTYYFSPHSPTQLRFPPSPNFTEWRGRCFRCCRTGHSASLCRNPKRCGKCWGEGHVGAHCKGSTLNPAAMPYWSSNSSQPQSQGKIASGESKLFLDLLRCPTPAAELTMPTERPKRISYFAETDEATLSEIARLENGVVFQTNGYELGFSVQDVAQFATRTKLVDKSEISVSALSKESFLKVWLLRDLSVQPDTSCGTPVSPSSRGHRKIMQGW